MSRASTIRKYQQTKGLGRLPAVDPGDKLHPMSAHILSRVALPDSKIWRCGPVLDQGSTPQCVAYSWTAFLMAAPLMDKATVLGSGFEQKLYDRAQQLDEWPGEGYDGTSVRAGAKALMEQRRLSEYIWADNADVLRRYILSRGPVIIGINWHEEMFLPDSKGFLNIGGGIAGGHAILAPGYSNYQEAFRVFQTWGRPWGQNGRAWLRFRDMETLLEEGGEACSAIEIKVV